MTTPALRRPLRSLRRPLLAVPVVLLALGALIAGCADANAPSEQASVSEPAPDGVPGADSGPAPAGDETAGHAQGSAPSAEGGASHGGDDARGPARVLPWPEPPAEIDPTRPRRWGVEVVEIRPHDPTAFTQGLELHGDVLLESTGLYGESGVRLVDPLTGETLLERPLDAELFGEGLTRVGDTVLQLTWRSGTLLRWQLPGLEPLAPLAYDGEGWGICAAEGAVFTSDGSAVVSRRDPATFEVTRSAEVTLAGEPVTNLNELECIDGLVVANVWHSDSLMVFDPDDGAVLAVIDASALSTAIDRPAEPEAVLNGVADLGDGTLLLTGKLWPSAAVVRLTPG